MALWFFVALDSCTRLKNQSDIFIYDSDGITWKNTIMKSIAELFDIGANDIDCMFQTRQQETNGIDCTL